MSKDISFILEVPPGTKKREVTDFLKTHNYKLRMEEPILIDPDKNQHAYDVIGPNSNYKDFEKAVKGMQGYKLWANPQIGPRELMEDDEIDFRPIEFGPGFCALDKEGDK